MVILHQSDLTLHVLSKLKKDEAPVLLMAPLTLS